MLKLLHNAECFLNLAKDEGTDSLVFLCLFLRLFLTLFLFTSIVADGGLLPGQHAPCRHLNRAGDRVRDRVWDSHLDLADRLTVTLETQSRQTHHAAFSIGVDPHVLSQLHVEHIVSSWKLVIIDFRLFLFLFLLLLLLNR